MLHDTYKPTVAVSSPNRVGCIILFFSIVFHSFSTADRRILIYVWVSDKLPTLISLSLFSSQVRDGHVGRYR